MNSYPRARVPGRLLLACAFAAPLVSFNAFAAASTDAPTEVSAGPAMELPPSL